MPALVLFEKKSKCACAQNQIQIPYKYNDGRSCTQWTLPEFASRLPGFERKWRFNRIKNAPTQGQHVFAWDSGVGDWIGKIVEASGLDLKVLFAGDKSPVQIDRRKVRRAPAPGFQWETEDSVKGGRVINCLVKYDQTLAFVQQDFIANEDGDEDRDEDDHKSGDGNVEGNGGDAPEEGAHESGDGGSNGSVEKSGGKANDSANDSSNDSSNGSSNDSSLFQSSNESGDESGNGSGSEGSDQRGDSGHESEGTEDSDESNNKDSETESEEADTHTKGARSNWHPCPYVS